MMPLAQLLVWGIVAFFAIACGVGWASYPGAWVPATFAILGSIVALVWGIYIAEHMWLDIRCRRAEHRRLMREAGYVEATKIRTRTITHPDGTIIEEEARGPFNRERLWYLQEQPAAPSRAWQPGFEMPQPAQRKGENVGIREKRLRALLEWIYASRATGAGWDQGPGRKAFPGTYDADMLTLQERGLIVGRSTGHQGQLCYASGPEALRVFDGL